MRVRAQFALLVSDHCLVLLMGQQVDRLLYLTQLRVELVKILLVPKHISPQSFDRISLLIGNNSIVFKVLRLNCLYQPSCWWQSDEKGN